MKETCKKMQEVFITIVEDGGVVNMNDPQTIQALNGVKIDDVKYNNFLYFSFEYLLIWYII